MFHTDVVKVDRDVAYVASVYPQRFIYFFIRMLQVCLFGCRICFTHMLQVFYRDVVYVFTMVSSVFQVFLQVFQIYILSVSSVFRHMLQVLHLNVSKVDRVLYLPSRLLLPRLDVSSSFQHWLASVALSPSSQCW